MRPAARNVLILSVALLAATAGYFVRHTGIPVDDPAQSRVARDAGASVLALVLPDSDGTPQALAQWRGKILVVNFWATWCPPCLREIPDFAAVSRRFADAPVQFVGIGVDRPDNVRKFAAEMRLPYPLLVAPLQTLQLTAPLGNTAQALPFSLIFDQRSDLRLVRLGTLNEAGLEGKIRALLTER